MSIRPIEEEDLIVWPDGSYCYYHELAQMDHKSDDFEVVAQDTPRYEELTTTA